MFKVLLPVVILAAIGHAQTPQTTGIAPDVFTKFELARTSALWNNQISTLLMEKELERALIMTSSRVAYEVADLKNMESKLNQEELKEAKELYELVFPTLKALKGTKFLENMPPKYQTGIKKYFEDMEKR